MATMEAFSQEKGGPEDEEDETTTSRIQIKHMEQEEAGAFSKETGHMQGFTKGKGGMEEAFSKPQGDFTKLREDFSNQEGDFSKEQGFSKLEGDFSREQGFSKEEGDFIKLEEATIARSNSRVVWKEGEEGGEGGKEASMLLRALRQVSTQQITRLPASYKHLKTPITAFSRRLKVVDSERILSEHFSLDLYRFKAAPLLLNSALLPSVPRIPIPLTLVLTIHSQ